MKQVLRNDEGITHIYYCTINGQNYYLTKEAYDRLLELDGDDICRYYSGEIEEEYESMKDDLIYILTNEMPVETKRFYIARSIGMIEKGDYMVVNG